MPNKKHLISLVFALLLGISVLGSLHLMRERNSKYPPLYEQYFFLYSDAFLGIGEDKLLLMKILPFVSGIFSILILYIILNKITKDELQSRITIFFWILSPSFVFLFGTYNSLFIPLTIMLFSLLLLINNLYLFGLMSIVFSLLLQPNLFPIVVSLLIFFQFPKKKVFPSIAIIILFYISISSKIFNQDILNLLAWIISDFGTNKGISIFNIMLSFVGMLYSWKNKEKYPIAYIALLSLGICSLYNNIFVPFLDLGLLFFSGLGFTRLLNRRWESNPLKTYLLLLIVCGFLFSTASYINRVSKAGPNEKEISSLKWLRDNNNGGKVLSHYEYGFIIKAFSNLEPYVDKNYFLNSNQKIRINDSNRIFSSRDLKEITDFFQKENIKYLWINKKMAYEQVWKKDDDGMLLIIKNTNKFKKVYDDEVEIWEFIHS